ncbi:uncharacterized protein LOC103512048 [Trichonephila clavipes]|nr:uncharacterized protein LOC103512048 [Trichonephila clavipes]
MDDMRMYRAKYPGRQLPSRSFFATLHRRLCETGSFNAHKLNTGRQRTTRTVDAEDRVLQELERNPSTSTRVVSRETNIPQATVWRNEHDEGLHPYHLQRVQALELGDYTKRMDFARWFLHESNADRNFAANVLFTDEVTLSLEGVMNFHNLHTWADGTPHAIRPHGAQRKCPINVWAGIVGDCLLGPYILPEILNGSMYLTFLQEVLPEMLNDVPMLIRQSIRFQHDGATAHFSIDVRAHLQTTFPGGWIGWGLVYETPVATPEDLVGRIVTAAGCVRDTPGIFEKVRGSMQLRCQACLDASEKNFEKLLTATAGSDVVQSGRPIFDDFFQHLWPYIVNNTANVVFQMGKRLWLIRIDQ